MEVMPDHEPRVLDASSGEDGERFALLADALAQLIWGWDQQGQLLFCNSRWYAYTGQTPAEAHGRGWMRAIHPEDEPRLAQRLCEALGCGRSYQVEYRLWCAVEGGYRRHVGHVLPRKSPEGQILEWINASTEIETPVPPAEALLASEQRLRALIEAAPYGAYEYELQSDGRLLFVGFNPAANRIIGVDHQQFLGKTIEEAFPPLVDTPIPAAYRAVAATGRRYEDQVAFGHGQISGVFEISAFQTAPHRMAVLFRDITERRRAENALRESEERLRMALSAAEMGTWCWVAATNQDTWDANLNRMLGREAGESTHHFDDFLASIHAEDREAVQAAFTRAVQQRDVFVSEYRVRHADGTLRWLRDQGRPLFDESGNLISMTGVVVDITERKRMEEVVLESQRRLATLLSNLPGMAYRCQNDPEWTMEFISQGCSALTGYPPSDFLGNQERSFASLIHPEDQQRVWEEVQQAIAEKRQYQQQYRIVTASGDEKWIWEQGVALYSETGQLEALEGLMTDFTEHKRAEESLHRQAAFDSLINRILARFASCTGAEIDPQITTVLQEIGGFVGAREVELLQIYDDRTAWRVTHGWRLPGTPPRSPRYDEILHGKLADSEARLRRGETLQMDPSDVPALEGDRSGAVRIVPLRGGGQVTGCLGLRSGEQAIAWEKEDFQRLQIVADVIANVLERQRIEEELRQHREQLEELVQQRTKQLRALTAELAQTEHRERRRMAQLLHDHLQQLLVAVRVRMLMLRRGAADPASAEMHQAVVDLLDQCLAESRSLTLELSPPVLYDAGLAPALHWLARWMQEKHGFTVEVHAQEGLEIAEEGARVFLFEAVRELLFNAVKHAHTDRAQVTITQTTPEMLQIEVRDDGIGFDPACLDSQTTSGAFGLFNIRERLRFLGGRLEIQARRGAGTRVLLTVPRRTDLPLRPPLIAAPGAPATQETPAAPALAGEEELPRDAGEPIRLLLVDDHPILRKGLADLVRIRPEVVVVGEAGDGQEAVDLALLLKPDVILMDITMPRMDGIEATRRITAALDHVRVIGLSMHEGEEMATAMRGAGAVGYMTKGGDPDALIAAILTPCAG